MSPSVKLLLLVICIDEDLCKQYDRISNMGSPHPTPLISEGLTCDPTANLVGCVETLNLVTPSLLGDSESGLLHFGLDLSTLKCSTIAN